MGDADRLIERIKEHEIKQKPAWQFRGMNLLAWISYVLFVVFGAIASSIIFFAIQQSEFNMLEHMNHSRVEWLLSLVPIIWLFFIILFLGHALNIILCLMSILVHGVRLNTLEFSRHVGLEWAGFKYDPFARSAAVDQTS